MMKEDLTIENLYETVSRLLEFDPHLEAHFEFGVEAYFALARQMKKPFDVTGSINGHDDHILGFKVLKSKLLPPEFGALVDKHGNALRWFKAVQ